MTDRISYLTTSSAAAVTWGPATPQPFPPPYLSQVIYDPDADTVVSVGPCPGSHPPHTESLSDAGCGKRFPCWSKSTDDGSHWSTFTPAGKGNGTYGGAEGTLGTALSSGNLLSPFSVKNCSAAMSTAVNRVLISSDHSKTWQVIFTSSQLQLLVHVGLEWLCSPWRVLGRRTHTSRGGRQAKAVGREWRR